MVFEVHVAEFQLALDLWPRVFEVHLLTPENSKSITIKHLILSYLDLPVPNNSTIFELDFAMVGT